MVYNQQPQVLIVIMHPRFQVTNQKRRKQFTKNKSQEGVECPLAAPNTDFKRAYTEAKKNPISILGMQSHEEVLFTGMLWDKPVHDFRRDAR